MVGVMGGRLWAVNGCVLSLSEVSVWRWSWAVVVGSERFVVRRVQFTSNPLNRRTVNAEQTDSSGS